MFFNFINSIRTLSNLDFNRFINFLKQCRVYPNFTALYDFNDYNEDLEYFKVIFNIGGINK